MSDKRPVYDMNYEGCEKNNLAVALAVNGRRVPEVMRKGYDFTGWYLDAACTEKAEPDPYGDKTYYAGWEPWDDEKTRMMEDYEKRMRRAKYIMARPKAYDWQSFVPYYRSANELVFGYEGNNILPDAHAFELLDRLDSLEVQLVQKADPESNIWYIWGDHMAEAPDAGNYDYFMRFDYQGFRPFLIPYMLEDQSTVKANVIVIAGGGYSQRWNQTEGYNMAEAFNALGYNAFVLQRRVTPSTPTDTFLDLQRSIRYIKYNAEKYGIGAIENIATAGFSGGGGTIVGALEKFYGDILPTVVYPDYVPDEIDAVNADYGVAMPIYGGYGPKTDDNPRFPALFVAAGAKDDLMLNRHAEEGFFSFMYRHPEVDCEIHIFAGVPHGFGTGMGAGPEHHLPGPGYVGADNWMKLADDFMMVRFGIVPQTYEKGCRPVK